MSESNQEKRMSDSELSKEEEIKIDRDISDTFDNAVLHVSKAVLSRKYEDRGGFWSISQFKFLVISEVEHIARADLRFYDDAYRGTDRINKLLGKVMKKYCVGIEGHALGVVKEAIHSRLAVEDKKKENPDAESMEDK